MQETPFPQHNIFDDKLVTKEGLRKVLSQFAKDTQECIKETWSTILVVELNNLLYPQLFKLRCLHLDRQGKAAFEITKDDFPSSDKIHKLGKALNKVEVSINEKNWERLSADESIHIDFGPATPYKVANGDVFYVKYTYSDLTCSFAFGNEEIDQDSYSRHDCKLGDVLEISEMFPYNEIDSDNPGRSVLYDYVLYKDGVEVKRLKYFETIVIKEHFLGGHYVLKKTQMRKVLDVYNDLDKAKSTFIIPIKRDNDNNDEHFTARNTPVQDILNILQSRFNITNIFHNADWDCKVTDSRERTEIVFTRKVYKYNIVYETSHLGGLTEKPKSFEINNFDRNFVHALDGDDAEVYRAWAALYLSMRYPNLYSVTNKHYEDSNHTYYFRYEFYESRAQYYDIKKAAAFTAARTLFFEAFNYQGALSEINVLLRDFDEAKADTEVLTFKEGMEHYMEAINKIHAFIRNKQFDQAVEYAQNYQDTYSAEGFDPKDVMGQYITNIAKYLEDQQTVADAANSGDVLRAIELATAHNASYPDYNQYFLHELERFNLFIEYQTAVLQYIEDFKIADAEAKIAEYFVPDSHSLGPDYGNWFANKLNEVQTFLLALNTITDLHEKRKFEEERDYINTYIAANKPDYIDKNIPREEKHWILDKQIILNEYFAMCETVKQKLNSANQPNDARDALSLVQENNGKYPDIFFKEFMFIGCPISRWCETIDIANEKIAENDFDGALTELRSFNDRQIYVGYEDYDFDYGNYISDCIDNLLEFIEVYNDSKNDVNSTWGSGNTDTTRIMDYLNETNTNPKKRDFNNLLKKLYWKAQVNKFFFAPVIGELSEFERIKRAGTPNDVQRLAIEAYRKLHSDEMRVGDFMTFNSLAFDLLEDGTEVPFNNNEENDGLIFSLFKVAYNV